MRGDARKVFRLDNEVLAFRFTATVSDRASDRPHERLTTPAMLELWLDHAGLTISRQLQSGLNRAILVREAIYRVGVTRAAGSGPDQGDVALLNTTAAIGKPWLELEGERTVWRLRRETALDDALAVLAQDAIRVLGGPDRAHIKVCEGPGCAGLFLDTSRGTNRRWCSMNTCGNKVKKTRYAKQPPARPPQRAARNAFTPASSTG